jgi:hypothetical protein
MKKRPPFPIWVFLRIEKEIHFKLIASMVIFDTHFLTPLSSSTLLTLKLLYRSLDRNLTFI